MAMHYWTLPPSPALASWVECHWGLVQDTRGDARPEKIVPDGHPELIFQLGEPYHENGRPQPRSLLVGQMRRWMEVTPSGRVELYGVRLRPHGLAWLLGEPSHRTTDGQLELAEWAPRLLVELEERLAETPDRQRVRLVEETLLRCAQRPRGADALDPVLEAVERSHGQLRVDALARLSGWSPRSLDRHFRERVGLSPKLFLRQVRFQRVFELLREDPRPKWSEVALAAGCYDQAHLSREFRAFAGESPESFLKAQHELSAHLTGLEG